MEKKLLKYHFSKYIKNNQILNYKNILTSNFIGFTNSAVRFDVLKQNKNKILIKKKIKIYDWFLWSMLTIKNNAIFTNRTVTQYNIFKNSVIGPLKTDIFRYCILYDQGGYYFDISRGCDVPLTKLHNNKSKFILTYEDTECYIPPSSKTIFDLKRPFNHILQWGLAFEKNNNFLKILIKEIIKAYPLYKNKKFSNPKLAILNFTGPGMYTKVMRKYLSNNSIRNFKELDIRFNGHGIFKLKGSQVRYHLEPSYTYLKDKKICL